MSKDVIQNELESCLSEIELIENSLSSQLEYLGETVDVGFKQMNSLGLNSLNLMSQLLRNPKSAVGIAVVYLAFYSAISAIQRVKAAKAHNRALDELLVLKEKIAREKNDEISFLKTKIDHVLCRLEVLYKNEASCSFTNNGGGLESLFDIKLSIMDRTLAI